MTGTSADGVDAALVRIDTSSIHLAGRYFLPYPEDIRARVITLAHSDTAKLDELFQLDRLIGEILADAVNHLLDQENIAAESILVTGSHGQTIRHRPDPPHQYSVQIGNPNILTARTAIDVVSDFRRADMAFGGQGAPFASLFHDHYFRSEGRDTAVLNLGGIANITILKDGSPAMGFDTGPANALLDDWIQFTKKQPFDPDGSWAAAGTVDQDLLQSMLNDPYFKKPAPKSTGREYFNRDWLQAHLQNRTIGSTDVQATLCELSALTIAHAIQASCPSCVQVYGCGGGSKNQELLRRLQRHLPNAKIRNPLEIGIDPDYLEAMVFAWLAYRHLQQLPGNLPSVTGSRRAAICGCLYPASR